MPLAAVFSRNRAYGDFTGSIACPYRTSESAEKKIPPGIADQLTNTLHAFFEDLETRANCSTLFPVVFERHRMKLSGETLLEGFMAVPECSMQCAPIRMKNVVDTPLACALKAEMRSDKAQSVQVTPTSSYD